MQLHYLTFTGADDNTNIDDLINISIDYPFVEWGILMSASRTNVPRYPSNNWLIKLRQLQNTIYKNTLKINFAVHLCGSLARQCIQSYKIPNKSELINYNRLQLNIAQTPITQTDLFEFRNKLDQSIELIIQLQSSSLTETIKQVRNYSRSKSVVPFFDASGGRGIHPDQWPTPIQYTLNGYGGGINYSNIPNTLKTLSTMTSNCWIDMESSLRIDDKFSIDTCLAIIHQIIDLHNSKIITIKDY